MVNSSSIKGKAEIGFSYSFLSGVLDFSLRSKCFIFFWFSIVLLGNKRNKKDLESPNLAVKHLLLWMNNTKAQEPIVLSTFGFSKQYLKNPFST